MKININSICRIICFIDLIYAYYVLFFIVYLIRYDFKLFHCWHGFIICYLIASCCSFSCDFKKEFNKNGIKKENV